MSDLQLDLSDLRLAKARVTTSLTTFQEAGRVGEDISGYTGEDRLRGKVRDFADNWDYNRGKLQEQLEFLRDSSAPHRKPHLRPRHPKAMEATEDERPFRRVRGRLRRAP